MAFPVGTPFIPIEAQNVTVTGSSAATSLGTQASFLIPGNRVIRFHVEGGGDDVFFKFGTSTVTVTTSNGTRLAAGSIELFCCQPGSTHVAMISSSGGSVAVNLTTGHGL